MKIYSWNMLFKNREVDRAFTFIRDSEWDVFSLQEVPEEFLARLKTLPSEIVSASDTDRKVGDKHSTHYVVILSRHPIRKGKPLPLPYFDPSLPLRAKLFIRMMFALGLWTKGLGNRHSLYADIELPTGSARVFNLHLSLLTPATRRAEFELAMSERDSSLPTIVCGDFNILESLHITALNFFLGGHLSDVFFYYRERVSIEKEFSKRDLRNPLLSKSTHPISHSQLDHILVSDSFSVANTEVLKDRMGSDHRPISVEIDSSRT